MNTITKHLTNIYTWLTTRTLELEHYGMIAVIIISTWHVSQHMGHVEGSNIVAIIMGMVLGFLNATFALRFFEERNETRWPAGVGLIFSALVSIWMQYGFYDNKSDLVKYMIVDNKINLNALVFGAWAPAFEILLGWLYGVRLHIRGATNSIIDAIKAQYQKIIDDLTAQKTAQLTTEQSLRDQLHQRKIDHEQSIIENEKLLKAKDHITEKLREEIDQLHTQITDLRVLNAEIKGRSIAQPAPTITPAQSPAQLTSKLTTEERHTQLLKIVAVEPEISRSELARRLNAARNTIKTDLETLQSSGRIHVNGAIHLVG